MILGIAAPARAQVGAGLSWESDYRYRGRTLSDGAAIVAVNLAYDHASGAYVGASLAAGNTPNDGVEILGDVLYAGFARRLEPRITLDLGLSQTAYTFYRTTKRRFENKEIYVGLLFSNFSARAHYASDYFGTGRKTLYVDLYGAYRLTPRWRVFGHAGELRLLNAVGSSVHRARYDYTAGVARIFDWGEVSFSWMRTDPYPAGRRDERDTSVLKAIYLF